MSYQFHKIFLVLLTALVEGNIVFVNMRVDLFVLGEIYLDLLKIHQLL